MAELSYPWGGAVTGDAALAPYTDGAWSNIWRKLFSVDRSVQGVVPGYLNQLQVTNPSGTTVRVRTGAALVDGKFYENTSDIDDSIASDGTWSVVLRKDFTAQTVRVAIISGTSPTQSDGITWEIKLAEVVRSGASISLTDHRNFLNYSTVVSTSMLEDLSITAAKLAADAVTTIKVQDLAITQSKFAAGAVMDEVVANDGPGSGLDADLLDGQHGSYYLETSNTNASIGQTADLVLTDSLQVLPNLELSLAAGATYLLIAQVHIWVEGTAGQHGVAIVRLAIDSVLQSFEGHNSGVVGAANERADFMVVHNWINSGASARTARLEAYRTADSLATVTSKWNIARFIAIRLT